MTTGAEAQKRREMDLAWELHETRRVRGKVMVDTRPLLDRLSGEQNHRCCWCGVRTTDEPGPTQATVEHVLPKADRGADSYGNLAMACQRCNTSRDAEQGLDWRPRYSRFLG